VRSNIRIYHASATRRMEMLGLYTYCHNTEKDPLGCPRIFSFEKELEYHLETHYKTQRPGYQLQTIRVVSVETKIRHTGRQSFPNIGDYLRIFRELFKQNTASAL
jgi:hypothetical protein